MCLVDDRDLSVTPQCHHPARVTDRDDEDRRVGERDGHPDEVMRPPSGRSTVGTSARLVTADKENTP